MPTSDAHHPCVTVICASLSAAWCPRVMPITHASPSFARHRQPHGAHERCPSPARRRHSRVAVGRMVPKSDAHHPHVAVICASPSATRCLRAMPVTHPSPLPACRHRPHSAHKRCPSPAHRRCLHVAVGRTVPTSDARHLHVTIACVSPLPWMCRHCNQLS